MREPSVVTWSLLERERTLGMSVCVWQPLLFSSVVIWQILTCFLGAINLQGKESRINEKKLSEVLIANIFK